MDELVPHAQGEVCLRQHGAEEVAHALLEHRQRPHLGRPEVGTGGAAAAFCTTSGAEVLRPVQLDWHWTIVLLDWEVSCGARLGRADETCYASRASSEPCSCASW